MTLPAKEWVDLVSYWASLATLIGLPLAFLTAVYAAVQFSLGRKAASAGAVIPINDTFRQCWIAYRGATTDADKRYYFAELANALEMACAIFRDNVLSGASRDVLQQYLINVFEIIESNQNATQLLGSYLETPKTFENIVWFLKHYRPARS